MALDLRRAADFKWFELKVKQSWPFSECSQYLSMLYFFLFRANYYLIARVLAKHARTKVQKLRAGCTFVRTSVGARGPHLTHTYEQMHPLCSGPVHTAG